MNKGSEGVSESFCRIRIFRSEKENGNSKRNDNNGICGNQGAARERLKERKWRAHNGDIDACCQVEAGPSNNEDSKDEQEHLF